MNRSIFYDGVEIYSEHLNYIEESKIEAIKNIVLTYGITGRVKGLDVVPDSYDPYKITVKAGVGYTYGGEYYELVNDVNRIDIVNEAGILNYVCVKVVQVESFPLPNIFTLDVKYTKIHQVYEVVVLSESDWLNLVDKSMYSLLAIVVGSGDIVRAGDIRKSVVLPASLLFVDRQPIVVKGVKVVTVSNNMALGDGVLKYDYDSINGISMLSWKAPNTNSFGDAVVVGGDGIYKLWDVGQLSYIQVDVIVSNLLSESVQEVLKIVDVFSQHELGVGTMNDVLHRSMMGGGMPSLRNPHGQTLDDLDPGKIQNMEIHQVRFHSPGIIGDFGSFSLVPSLYDVKTVKVQNVTVGESVISAGKVFESVKNVYVDFSGKVSGLYYVYVNEFGSVVADQGVDDRVYFIIASVEWDGVVLSNLRDLRVWGSSDPRYVIYADKENVVDPNIQNVYSLADSLGVIRWVLKGLIGNVSWKDLPSMSVNDIINNFGNAINILQTNTQLLRSDLDNHVGASYRTYSGDIHGVRMGHTGGFDADMLEGFHASKIPAPNVIPVAGDNGKLDAGFIANFIYDYIVYNGTGEYEKDKGYIKFGNIVLQFGTWVIKVVYGSDSKVVNFLLPFTNVLTYWASFDPGASNASGALSSFVKNVNNNGCTVVLHSDSVWTNYFVDAKWFVLGII